MRRFVAACAGLWRAWRTQTAPLPRVRAQIGVWVPGWAVRAGAGLVAGAAVGLGFAHAGYMLAALIVGAIWLVWTIVVPGTPGWVVGTALLGATQLAVGATRLGYVIVVAVLAYGAYRATWWAAHIAPRGRVSLRAIGRAGRWDLLVLAASIVLAALVWWLGALPWADGGTGAGLALGIGAVAIVGLGIGAAWLVRRAG